MEREKPTFDILGRIRGTNCQRLDRVQARRKCRNDAIHHFDLEKKKLQPNVASIEKICDGLGITLA